MPKTEGGHTDIFYARVDEVVITILKNERFLQSKRLKELVALVGKNLNVEQRTAYDYVNEAKREIRRMGKEKKNKAFKKAIQDREFIVASAKQSDNLKLALDAMKDRDEIFGLYETQIKHTGKIDLKNINLSSLTDEQLVKLKNFLKNGVELKEALLHVGVIIK